MKLSNALMGITLAATIGACAPKAPEKTPSEIEKRTTELTEILKAQKTSSIHVIRTMVQDNCGEVVSYDRKDNIVTFGCQDANGYRTEDVAFDEVLPIKTDE